MFSGDDIKNRIESVKEELQLTAKSLAEKGKTTDRTLVNIKSGKSTPNAKILYYWSENLGLNINWLLTGKGDMFKSEEGFAAQEASFIVKRLMVIESSMDRAANLARLEAMKAVIEGEIALEEGKKGIAGELKANG
ncbi:helix-turn-helix transcriptional regulator [Maridesulfovibrio ferrireducens]|uniref:helix-turn-helix domain-containing protein n=1 Tax=Maridesulfovibrio ferrireducens TaxID=246191 RepID=UPI001A240AE0|nr:helix-turn-helix transcriptional regulator [Maridesulfovibrio ferrireducens]MBI9113355.1 helix-turn-helix transcriptional regulator [Maridesulfovibrio ferrireducens]